MRNINIEKTKLKVNGKSKNGKAIETQTQNSAKTTLKESGGPRGLEPTRYGDWEQKGRCTDF